MKTLKNPINHIASSLFWQVGKPLWLVGIFNMSKEIWKDIPGYEGYYQVSNLGRVKSLDMMIKTKSGSRTFRKGKIRSVKISKGAKYKHLILCKDGKKSTKTVHVLVAEAFLNHIPCAHKIEVDHINGDKLDNRLHNLQLLSQRANNSKSKKPNSGFTGVYWRSDINKWRASIVLKGIRINLGHFDCRLRAAKAYNDKLNDYEG